MFLLHQLDSYLRPSTTTPNVKCTDRDGTLDEPILPPPLQSNGNTMETKNPTENEPEQDDMPTYAGLEQYRLLSMLGDGAFSTVFKALDRYTNETVAIKIVRKLELNTGQRSSILKEVKLMRSFQHDSIVCLLGFIETKDFYFLILELCDGGELFHQIVHLTYFSEDLSRHCIWQVAEGIRYLHEEKGVVHRDIKPENLLFESIPFIEYNGPERFLQPEDESKVDEGGFIKDYGGGGIGKVKIADFGLSKILWDRQTRTPCGTLDYLAPEVIRDGRYSASIDIWALGCVLYTMLCGFPPFYDDSVELLTEKVMQGNYSFVAPWWDSISDEAKDLISHALCMDPNERYDIHQFMQHPWMLKQASISGPDHSNLATNRIPDPPSETSTNLMTNSRDIPCGNKIFGVSYELHRKHEERIGRTEHQGKSGFFFGRYLNPDMDSDGDGDGDEFAIDDGDSDDDESIEGTPKDDTALISSPTSVKDQHQPVTDVILPSEPSFSTRHDNLKISKDEANSLPFLIHDQRQLPIPIKPRTRNRRMTMVDLNLDKASLLERRKGRS